MRRKQLIKGGSAIVFNHPDKAENGKVVKLNSSSQDRLHPLLWLYKKDSKKKHGFLTIVSGDYWFVSKPIRVAERLESELYVKCVEAKYLLPFKLKKVTA